MYGGDTSQVDREPRLLDPATEAARVRAMYTHPDFTRRGVGRMVLDAAEQAASAEGFSRVELMATLSGAPLYRARVKRWGSAEWAAVAVYLDFLVRFPDSHVARKSGLPAAEQVSREAKPFASALQQTDNPEQMAGQMLEWDSRLKQQGHNPGTSADLTVASLLATRLQDLLEQELTDRAPANGARGNSTGERSRTLSTTL